MSKSTLNNRVTSCCPEIVKALCAQICELEAKVESLEIEVSEIAGKWAYTEHQLENTQTQCNDLCLRLNYFRRNYGDEPDDLNFDP